MLLARRPLWSVVMRKHRNLTDNHLNYGEKKLKRKNRERSSFFSTSLLPAAWSLCFCGKHLGSFIPARHPWGPLCPLRLQGLSVLQSGSLLLLWKRGAQACWLACLATSQSSHAPFPLLCQAPSPSQMPWSMVSVALHVNWKILNRFIQKLQWRQPALRFRGISRQRVKSVKLQINVSECVRAWTCLTCLWSQDLPNEASRHTLYLKRMCKESTPITQDRRWNDWEVQSALLFDI